MAAPCYYHPDQTAVDTCVQCGMPICADCRENISSKSVCKKCVGAMRARLEQEMAASPASAYAPGPVNSPYASNTAPPVAGPRPVPAAPHNPNALVMGLVAGALIGLVGAIVAEKVTFLAHFSISYLYIAVGYGIGWGIHRFTGRGGPGLALTAVGIMVACLVVSHIVYVSDMLSAAKASGSANPAMTVTEAFPQVIGGLGILYWACIAIGLFACYRGVAAQGR